MAIGLLDIIANKFLVMLLKNDTQITFYTEHYDVDAGNGINLNETDLFVYHVLKKQLDDDGPLYLNDTTSQYLDVFFAQETIDWTKPYNQRYEHKDIPARACT